MRSLYGKALLSQYIRTCNVWMHVLASLRSGIIKIQVYNLFWKGNRARMHRRHRDAIVQFPFVSRRQKSNKRSQRFPLSKGGYSVRTLQVSAVSFDLDCRKRKLKSDKFSHESLSRLLKRDYVVTGRKESLVRSFVGFDNR